VRLTQKASEALREHRKAQLAEGTANTPGLVFTNRAGQPLHAKNVYDRDWTRLVRRAGLEGYTFHTCRHTFATALLRANVHPKQVQEALGHSSIAETLDTYSHLMPDQQQQVVRALEAAF
jgi:integrase